jgi:hypothetical protein
MKDKLLDLLVGMVFISILAGVVRLIEVLFKSYSDHVFIALIGLFFLLIMSLIGEGIRNEWKSWRERKKVEKTMRNILGR